MSINGSFPDRMDNAVFYALRNRESIGNREYNELMKAVDETAKEKCSSFYELGFSMARIQELKRKRMYNEALEEVKSLDAQLKKKRDEAMEFWQQCFGIYDILPDCGRKKCLEKLFNHHSQMFGNMEIMLREFYNRNVYMKSARME